MRVGFLVAYLDPVIHICAVDMNVRIRVACKSCCEILERIPRVGCRMCASWSLGNSVATLHYDRTVSIPTRLHEGDTVWHTSLYIPQVSDTVGDDVLHIAGSFNARDNKVLTDHARSGGKIDEFVSEIDIERLCFEDLASAEGGNASASVSKCFMSSGSSFRVGCLRGRNHRNVDSCFGREN